MRLLVVAPTCDGTDVGEAWVAYQWASRLAARHQVTLLTYYKRGRPPARQQLGDIARVIEWPELPVVGRAERLNSMLKPSYVPFYWRARRWIQRALAGGERFDVVHQPLPVAMRYPSPATGLGIPLVFGPVGGGLASPAPFRTQEQDTTPWFVGLRQLDRLRLRHDPLLRRTYRLADCVLGIAPYVAAALGDLRPRRLEFISETALERAPDPVIRTPGDGVLRLLFVGRIVRTKGVRDLIGALHHVRDLPLTVDIVGDGPDRAACEAAAGRLGVSDRVMFHGRVPHDEVWSFYQRADIFTFPSYREPGGNAVFEAMGSSLPLIVCDRGGPAAAVDDSCAIRLPASTPAQLERDLATAIRTLAGDPARRLTMGACARDRLLRVGLWDSKIEWAERLYQELAPGDAAGGDR